MNISVESDLSLITTSPSLPSPRRGLPAGEIHVWQARLDELTGAVSQYAEHLSDDEQERAARYFFKRDSDYYIIGRGVLRILLGFYLGIKPRQVQFQYGSNGKPVLHESYSRKADLHFNLAHSKDMAVYAFGHDCDIGIDIEFIRPLLDAEQIAARFFSQRENALLSSLPQEQRRIAFFNCWTRKEAYIKALGSGLSQPLDQFAVSLAPGEPARFLHIAGKAQEEIARWKLNAWTPLSGYVAALAVNKADFEITQWQVVRGEWQGPLTTPNSHERMK